MCLHPLADEKRETPLSLKLVQTSLAQTKIYRCWASPASTDQACISLSLPSLSDRIHSIPHPSKSAAQITGGILRIVKNVSRGGAGLLWAIASLPESHYKGYSVPGWRFPPRALVFAFQPQAGSSRKISPLLNPARLGGGISGARWDPFLKPGPWGKLMGSTEKSSICRSLPLLPEGPGGLHHFVRGDAGDVDGNGDDGPGEPVVFQGASDHVPGRTKR